MIDKGQKAHSNRFGIQEWIFVLAAMLMMTGATVFPNYATDSYMTFANPAAVASSMLTRNARPVTALLYQLTASLHLSGVATICAHTVSGFVCLYLSIMLYEDSLRRYIKNDLIRCMVSALTICNIYIVEFFMFLEKVSFMFAILCCVVAYRSLQELVENRHAIGKTVCRYAVAIAALILSVCCYQPTLSLFVVLLLPVILRQTFAWKAKIKWLSVTAILYGLTGAMSLLILKMTGSRRVGSGTSLRNRVASFLSLPADSLPAIPKEVILLAAAAIVVLCIVLAKKSVRTRRALLRLLLIIGGVGVIGLGVALSIITISSFGIVPKGFWLFTVVTAIALCLLLAKNSIGRSSALLHLLLVIGGTEVCALFLVVLGVGWFTPRVIYVLGCLPMLIITFSYANGIFESENNTYEGTSKLLLCFLALVLTVSSIGMDQVYKEKYVANALDEYRCAMIGDAIRTYEEQSGNTVAYIAFYEDSSPDEYNAFLRTDEPGFRTSSFSTDWSDLNAINYYLDTNYSRGASDDAIKAQFAEKDWKIFSEEQLIFDGDTLHICNY